MVIEKLKRRGIACIYRCHLASCPAVLPWPFSLLIHPCRVADVLVSLTHLCRGDYCLVSSIHQCRCDCFALSYPSPDDRCISLLYDTRAEMADVSSCPLVLRAGMAFHLTCGCLRCRLIDMKCGSRELMD